MADKKADFESLEAYKEFLSGLDDIAEWRDEKGDKYSSSAKRSNTFSYPSKRKSTLFRDKGVPLTVAGNEILSHKEYKDEYFSNNPSHEIIKADGTKHKGYSYELDNKSGAAEGATFLSALVAEFEVLANKEAEDKISEKEQALLDSYRVFLTERTGMSEGGMAIDGQMNAVFKSSRTDLDSVPDNTVGVDPVSGNPVPLGSSPEEVRDDIPANLSENEYVVPADVVRYYGVKFFEDLRAQAKLGYQDMNENGRIGGEPMGMETVEPEDDMMFDVSELEVTEGYAEGGDVDDGGRLGLGSEGIGLSNVGAGVMEVREYRNDAGHTMMIMFLDGEPLSAIPEGYYPIGDAPAAVVKPEEESVVAQSDDGGPEPTDAPDPINYKTLSKKEMIKMLEDQQSMKGDVIAAGMGMINPIVGVLVKMAMWDSSRRLEAEIERRAKDPNMSEADRTDYEMMLEMSKKDKPGLLERIFKGKDTTKPLEEQTYTPETVAVDSQSVNDAVAEAMMYDPTSKGVLEDSDITVTELPDIIKPNNKAGEMPKVETDSTPFTGTAAYMGYGSEKNNPLGQGDSPTPITDAFGTGNSFTSGKQPSSRKPSYINSQAEKQNLRDASTIRDRQRKRAGLGINRRSTNQVIYDAADRGATNQEIVDMAKEALRIEQNLESTARGGAMGFKKGGLASKKKKK